MLQDHGTPTDSTATTRLHGDGFDVALYEGVTADRRRFEEELDAAGRPLPLQHRCAWAETHGVASWFVAVRRPTGECAAGFGLKVAASRALPGHLVLRCERLGPGGSIEATVAGIGALATLARRSLRVLRVHLELFDRDVDAREALGRGAGAVGFRRLPVGRSYARTVAVDLIPEESEILGRFRSQARYNLRLSGRRPVEVRAITDPALVPRMEQLLEETLARTGGAYRPPGLAAKVELSRRHPERSRIVGLFRTDRDGPEAMLSFAWSCHHGDRAEYSAAASTRDTDLHVPVLYAPAWDLIRWARRHGATWFDFGGVRPAGFGGDDPLGGISDFKRFFSRTVVDVGEEWVLDASPVRSRLARAISAGAAWLSRQRA